MTWLMRSSVAVIAGKGGVGSSTVAAAFALAAARAGADVLLVAVDGRPGLGPLLGGAPLGPDETVLRRLPKAEGGGRVRGRTIPASGAFADYLELRGVNAIVRKAASASSLDVIAAATPGLQHLLVLGKIKELDRERAADLIVVDAPPAGHAGPFLRSPSALMEFVKEGPVRDQAVEVAAMLADASRCRAIVVTLPEETPVNETIELAAELGGGEDRPGLALGPLVVNACWPERPGLDLTVLGAARAQGVKLPVATRRALESSAAFGRSRLQQQRAQFVRLSAALPLPLVELPRLPTARLGPEELEVLVATLAAWSGDGDR